MAVLELRTVRGLAVTIARWTGRAVALVAIALIWRPADVLAAVESNSQPEGQSIDIGDVTVAAVGDIDVDEDDPNTPE